MGFFGFGKKDKVVDLSEKYKMQQEVAKEKKISENKESSKGNAFGFFGSMSSSASQNPIASDEAIDTSENLEEKRRKLAKRLSDMTTKMEDLSTQIYHLQQRVELLEKKMSINKY